MFAALVARTLYFARPLMSPPSWYAEAILPSDVDSVIV
jgi:hypothetical protein